MSNIFFGNRPMLSFIISYGCGRFLKIQSQKIAVGFIASDGPLRPLSRAIHLAF